MTRFITKEQKVKWLEALRSGKYQKGEGSLHELNQGKHEYCCLGVYCVAVLNEDEYIREHSCADINVLSTSLHEDFNNFDEFKKEIVVELKQLNANTFKDSFESLIAELNDNTETFDRVIYYIEKYLPTQD